jgi:hypothetical protein
MAKQKITALTPQLMTLEAKSAPSANGRPEKKRVQTVKMTDDELMRLATFGIRTRRSNQDIIHTAVLEYLEKQQA